MRKDIEPTILVIEDDPITSRLVTLVLTNTGYQVASASNGIQGLEMAQDNPPGLILLDLMLPGLDGFDVLDQLRAIPQTSNVPVIVISSKSQPGDKQIASRLGADAYLTKPYKQPELLEKIHSLLNKT